MKQRSPASDDPLDSVLREWVVDDAAPPRFEENVWSRIAKEETRRPESQWLRGLAGWVQAFTRPAVAAAYLVSLVALGSGAGIWSANQERHRVERELGARYVHAIDPQLMASVHQ